MRVRMVCHKIEGERKCIGEPIIKYGFSRIDDKNEETYDGFMQLTYKESGLYNIGDIAVVDIVHEEDLKAADEIKATEAFEEVCEAVGAGEFRNIRGDIGPEPSDD